MIKRFMDKRAENILESNPSLKELGMVADYVMHKIRTKNDDASYRNLYLCMEHPSISKGLMQALKSDEIQKLFKYAASLKRAGRSNTYVPNSSMSSVFSKEPGPTGEAYQVLLASLDDRELAEALNLIHSTWASELLCLTKSYEPELLLERFVKMRDVDLNASCYVRRNIAPNIFPHVFQDKTLTSMLLRVRPSVSDYVPLVNTAEEALSFIKAYASNNDMSNLEHDFFDSREAVLLYTTTVFNLDATMPYGYHAALMKGELDAHGI